MTFFTCWFYIYSNPHQEEKTIHEWALFIHCYKFLLLQLALYLYFYKSYLQRMHMVHCAIRSCMYQFKNVCFYWNFLTNRRWVVIGIHSFYVSLFFWWKSDFGKILITVYVSCCFDFRVEWKFSPQQFLSGAPVCTELRMYKRKYLDHKLYALHCAFYY